MLKKQIVLLISADIPGLTKKDINIEVSDDVLSITGERQR